MCVSVIYVPEMSSPGCHVFRCVPQYVIIVTYCLHPPLAPHRLGIPLLSIVPPPSAPTCLIGVPSPPFSPPPPPPPCILSYSVRMSLLPREQQLAAWPATAGLPRALTSCQLMTRHWIIRDGEGRQVDEVRGEEE